ncbi:hypothetical protein OIU84_005756 [Salix udensis]|uniref:Endonuclease/exonuclease/phosphatase domain-containing protein n=1 Tax=Salix udensis TaxID=889485 RepID=A0AAD6JWR9_9ROSI|nr:hypothetical protein OIU84_005756 [Salix udensis]
MAPLFGVSFVYGMNSPIDRRDLWNYLSSQKLVNNSTPWGILGDFNAITSSRDRSGGDQRWYSHMDEYPSCITQTELIQIPRSGENNFRSQSHCPDVSSSSSSAKGKVSNFLNLWTQQEGYEEAIRAAWAVDVYGNPIIQRHLDMNPGDQDIRGSEREACYLYNKLNSDAESFFKQRSRVQWLKLGDKNTTFFHRSLLHRRARNHIHSFTSEVGEVVREPNSNGRNGSQLLPIPFNRS